MENATAILLILFCSLGVFDGLYFHIYKYRLHEHPSSRREHQIHTLRAFVFVPLSILLFVVPSGGYLLYGAIALVLLDLALELTDILEERVSRKPLGGISSEESAIHVFASSFKFAAVVLVLVTKDSQAFSLDSPLVHGEVSFSVLPIIGALFAGGCLVGGLYSVAIEHRNGLYLVSGKRSS
ncbi:MAG: hypothetical protein V4692_09060 [Bdellovibrionota bacterium]